MKGAGIRRVERRDLAALVELCAEHAAYEGAEYVRDGQAERLAPAFFAEPPILFGWVATYGAELVGFMTATRDFATWDARFFLHMDCLYLREPWRRRGLGRALMAELVRFAAAEGIDLIQWQTPPGNEPGIRFYESVGAYGKDKKRYFLPVESDSRILPTRPALGSFGGKP